MDYQNFKAIEPTGYFKSVARQALNGRWGLALGAGFLYTVLLNIPITVLDNVFGIAIDVAQYASLFGTDGAEILSAMESQGYSNDTVLTMSSPMSGVYLFLISAALSLGFSILAIHILRRAEADAGMVFAGFSNYFRSLGVMILIGLIYLLWAMVCIIPVALAAMVDSRLAAMLVFPAFVVLIVLMLLITLRYGLSFFILADNPKIGILECIKRSKMMMKGNKGKLFLLYLSFIGWYLLYFIVVVIIGTAAAVAFDIGSENLVGKIVLTLIAAVPMGVLISYLYVSTAAFYEKVSGISSGMFNLSQNMYYEDTQNNNNDANRIE